MKPVIPFVVACVAVLSLSATTLYAAEPPPQPAATARAVDRLQLDASAITGNRELPKVMSIVPWKAAEPPGGPDRPLGSLIDELLAPLDRDEFRREISYYGDLASPPTTVSTVPVPGAKL